MGFESNIRNSYLHSKKENCMATEVNGMMWHQDLQIALFSYSTSLQACLTLFSFKLDTFSLISVSFSHCLLLDIYERSSLNSFTCLYMLPFSYHICYPSHLPPYQNCHHIKTASISKYIKLIHFVFSFPALMFSFSFSSQPTYCILCFLSYSVSASSTIKLNE